MINFEKVLGSVPPKKKKGPTLDQAFGNAIGRAATGTAPQFAREDQANATKRAAEDAITKAEADKLKINQDFLGLADSISKTPKVKKNEALIAGIVAALGALGGAKNSNEALSNYIGNVTNKRTDEANQQITLSLIHI